MNGNTQSDWKMENETELFLNNGKINGINNNITTATTALIDEFSFQAYPKHCVRARIHLMHQMPQWVAEQDKKKLNTKLTIQRTKQKEDRKTHRKLSKRISFFWLVGNALGGRRTWSSLLRIYFDFMQRLYRKLRRNFNIRHHVFLATISVV